MNFDLFHKLEGENIYFKALDVKDVEEIHSYASDKDVKRFIGWKLMFTLEETREHIETMIKRESAGTHLYASIVHKKAQRVIGTAMIFNFDEEANHAEIGYVFHKDNWGKGYGTEMIKLMNNFAFEALNLHRLHARVVDENLGSARILQKNGFVLEGRLKDHCFIEGRYYDELIFGNVPHSND